MRDRAQASVETIALMAAAAALAAVLILGVVRLGLPLASALGMRSRASLPRRRPRHRASTASSGRSSPARRAPAPTARRCSTFALACARASGAAPPTQSSPRRCDRWSQTRSWLARSHRPCAPSPSSTALPRTTGCRARLDSRTGVSALPNSLGVPGAIRLPRTGFHLVDAPADAFPAGRAAGDVVVQLSGGGYSEVVLRRRPKRGLGVILMVFEGGGPAYAGRR